MTPMDELKLIEKLRHIQALYSGAATTGERVAAERARERILERLRLNEVEAPPAEYQFSMPDMWSRKVFVSLLRRYGIRPYRYKRQRYTTVMARVSKKFVDETLWPEYQEISETLHSYLSEVTDRVVSQVIHQDSSEADVVEEPQLPLPMQTSSTSSEHKKSTDQTNPASEEKTQSAAQKDVNNVSSKSSKNRKKRKRKKNKNRR